VNWIIAFLASVVFICETARTLAQERISFSTTDGGLIYADLYGAGDRGVVLAHGGQFNKESWREQALTLTKSGFRVLAIDFRGYGQSRAGAQTRQSDEDVRRLDVVAAIDYLRRTGSSTVSIVGASMGGDYAAEAAEALPDKVRRTHRPSLQRLKESGYFVRSFDFFQRHRVSQTHNTACRQGHQDDLRLILLCARGGNPP
jgi:esterase/lipase